jgi:hypothetical protein
MSTTRRFWLGATVLLASASGALGQAAAPPPITLKQYTYQTVRTPPFNGQLAFYAPDIKSSGKTVKLPVTIHILIGNGRRPFPTDDGTMDPKEFERYKSKLLMTNTVRAISFDIQKKGEGRKFEYLSRSYVVVATDLIPCSACADRVVLIVQPGAPKKQQAALVAHACRFVVPSGAEDGCRRERAKLSACQAGKENVEALCHPRDQRLDRVRPQSVASPTGARLTYEPGHGETYELPLVGTTRKAA